MTIIKDYPEDFYVAHKYFGEKYGWGDILDGPESDQEEVIEKIIEQFSKESYEIGRDVLRVWHVGGHDALEVTYWAIEKYHDTIAERLEE